MGFSAFTYPALAAFYPSYARYGVVAFEESQNETKSFLHYRVVHGSVVVSGVFTNVQVYQH
ncbi:MAG: hypothetical protein DRR19_07330 [Candidatus Parabeggiatoa sp. nov. 1]|nr:MAG: hypothetical protein DRR19_07330 [Gammaproteobacteria bacterium]